MCQRSQFAHNTGILIGLYSVDLASLHVLVPTGEHLMVPLKAPPLSSVGLLLLMFMRCQARCFGSFLAKKNIPSKEMNTLPFTFSLSRIVLFLALLMTTLALPHTLQPTMEHVKETR